MQMPHLSYHQMANACAVSFHDKKVVILAATDVELDTGAATVRVIIVCCFDGQYCVSHRSVLCQSVTAVLLTDKHRGMKKIGQHTK